MKIKYIIAGLTITSCLLLSGCSEKPGRNGGRFNVQNSGQSEDGFVSWIQSGLYGQPEGNLAGNLSAQLSGVAGKSGTKLASNGYSNIINQMSLASGGLTETKRNTSATECMEEIDLALAREQRMYRQVLFGLKPAEEAEAGALRYDTEGKPWIKTAEDTWETVRDGEFLSQSDSEMNSRTERDVLNPGREPFRRGIFETKRSLTSDYIPYLTQSIRALQCRAEAICELVSKSIHVPQTEPKQLTASVPGCIPMELPSISQCHLVHNYNNDTDINAVRTYCDQTIADMIDREEALLKMTVTYDASYRSTLQMAGIIDEAIDSFQFALKGTLRQVTDFLPVLDRLPCFTASCDSAPAENP